MHVFLERAYCKCFVMLYSLCTGPVKGLDVGCGANFIYCLLGAAMHGWHMVGLDVTDVAIDWATRNMNQNPQLQHLLEVRRSTCPCRTTRSTCQIDTPGHTATDTQQEQQRQQQQQQRSSIDSERGGVLTPAFQSEEETYTFTMCNPPFFDSMAVGVRRLGRPL